MCVLGNGVKKRVNLRDKLSLLVAPKIIFEVDDAALSRIAYCA